MLDQLVDIIEKLRSRIAQHRDYISELEPRTRTQLIDPLLTALGWDVTDPALVQIEPRVIEGWADYALMGGNGRRVLAYVEAKRLADRRDPVGQVVTYAVRQNVETGAGVQFCITTNGDRWVIYDVFSQKQLVDVSVVADDAEAVAFKLLSLWRRSFADGKLNDVEEPVLVETVDPPPLPPPPPELSNGLTWRDIPQPKEAKNTWGPQTIRFPDGTEANPKRSWRQTVVQTAKWLHDTDKLTPANLPVVSSIYSYMTYYLVSADGRHSDGSEFRKPHKVADGVILNYSEFNATNAVAKIQKLLEHCNIDVDSVRLGFRPEDLKGA